MVIISASLNSFQPSLFEIGGVYCNASNCVNMALMEKARPGQAGLWKIFRNVLMVAAILAHTSSCFNFLLKDDICRKY